MVSAENHVEWNRLPENDFNRFATAVLLRRHQDDPDHEAWAPDGRGGDDGIDVGVRRKADRVVERVYQLKYFPDGFSGNMKTSRQTQIRKSWKSARDHHADLVEWTLVTPLALTPGERQFVEGLQKDGDPTVSIMGPPELDQLLIEYPLVHDFITRNPMIAALRQAAMERAALVHVDDLSNRVSDLAKSADAISAYWGFDIEVKNGVTTQTLVPKRPDAAEKEPISWIAQLQFDEQHKDAKNRFRQVMEYGSFEPVTLDASVVKRLEQKGPEWAEGVWEHVQITVQSEVVTEPLHVEVRAISPAGVPRAVLPMTVDKRTGGGKGIVVHFAFRDSFEMTMTMGATSEGRVNFSAHVFGQPASDALKVVQFMEAMKETRTIALASPTFKQSPIALNPKTRLGRVVAPQVRSVIEDLAYIERETGVVLPVPTELVGRDRLMYRFARKILEGRIVMHPFVNGFDVELNGLLDDGVETVLAGTHRVVVTNPEYVLEVGDRTIPLGEVTFYAPEAAADDAEEHLAALRAGKGAGRKLHLGVLPHSGFVCFSQPRMTDPNVPAVPESLGLRKQADHKNLAKVRALGKIQPSSMPGTSDER